MSLNISFSFEIDFNWNFINFWKAFKDLIIRKIIDDEEFGM